MPPLAVGDRLFPHVPAGALDQCGKETVHRGKIGQVLEGPAANQLEAAPGVGCIIAQAEPAYSVRQSRLQPFEAAVVTAGAAAADDAKGGVFVLGGDGVPDAARIRRIVLAIAVEKLDPVAPAAPQAGHQGGGLAAALYMG